MIVVSKISKEFQYFSRVEIKRLSAAFIGTAAAMATATKPITFNNATLTSGVQYAIKNNDSKIHEMQSDIRVVLVTLLVDLIIFCCSLCIFLYLRRFRGDQTGVEILRRVHTLHEPQTDNNDPQQNPSSSKSELDPLAVVVAPAEQSAAINNISITPPLLNRQSKIRNSNNHQPVLTRLLNLSNDGNYRDARLLEVVNGRAVECSPNVNEEHFENPYHHKHEIKQPEDLSLPHIPSASQTHTSNPPELQPLFPLTDKKDKAGAASEEEFLTPVSSEEQLALGTLQLAADRLPRSLQPQARQTVYEIYDVDRHDRLGYPAFPLYQSSFGGVNAAAAAVIQVKKSSGTPSSSSPGNRQKVFPLYERDSWNDWLRFLIQVDDKRFKSSDVQFYLLFLKTCQMTTLFLGFVAIILILPINLSCSTRSSTQSWFDRASAVNIKISSNKIFIIMAVTWIYSFIIYYAVYRLWIQIYQSVLYRSDGFNPQAYTIMIEGISHYDTKTTSFIIKQHFELLFREKLVFANLILDFSEYMSARYKLKSAESSLAEAEALEAEQEYDGDVNSSVFSSFFSYFCCCCFNIRKNDVNAWREEVADRNNQLNCTMLNPALRNSGIAFAAFRDAACLCQCLDDPRSIGSHFDWHFSQAPPHKDIIWDNIHISEARRKCRSFILNFLLVFVSIVLTSSVVLTNAYLPLAENLEKAVSELNFLKIATVAGWGAPLILFIISSLCLPSFIYMISNMVGFWRVSQTESYILHGNVWFLILNTLIFPTIGNGSIGALILRAYQTEIQKWNVSLGLIIVGQSGSFAVRYLLNSCFLHASAQLIQFGHFLWFRLLALFNKTGEPWDFDFGYNYAFSLSIFFMVVSFGVIFPLVVPFGFLFFTFKYYIDKYNILFGVLNVNNQDSAGAVANNAAKYLLASVAFFQFVMSGYFIALGLHLDSRKTSKRSAADSIGPAVVVAGRVAGAAARTASKVVAGNVSMEKVAVLGGSLLFVVSLISVVLLIGHNQRTFSATKPRVSYSQSLEGDLMSDGGLTKEQETILTVSYTHPCELEIKKRLEEQNMNE